MISGLGRYVLSSCIALAMLTGCWASQLPARAPDAIPLRRPGGSPGYKATAPLLYVSNISAFNVTVYQAKGKDPSLLATITDGINTPEGACIDGQGTLYVANAPPGYGSVSEYPLGKTTASETITDGINSPAYCAVDGKGNLWVTNVYGPNATEYPKGSKKPHIVITDGLFFPIGIAIDRSGNLYVANFGATRNVNNVEVYAPGSKSPTRTITNGVTSPRGIAVDSQGTLYVANPFQNTVTEYRSGQSDPFQTITETTDAHPEAVAVDKKGVLYVGNVGDNTVVEFAPGSIKPLKRRIRSGLDGPIGVACYPPLLP